MRTGGQHKDSGWIERRWRVMGSSTGDDERTAPSGTTGGVTMWGVVAMG